MANTDNVEKIDLDKIDWRSSREFFESLGEALDKLDDKDESYNFTWVGKRKSIIEAGAPINKTLRPDIDTSKDFDNTKNMLIIGDNLDALKLLQESYLGKIKMIYIDPPYNTGHDFVYHDNFTVKKNDYVDNTTDSEDNIIISEDKFTENSKANGRFHSDWLSMIYPRLRLAKNLLSEDGVILVSINDKEQSNLKKICDEIFGEQDFVGQFVWFYEGVNDNQAMIKNTHEYIIVYQRSDSFEVNPSAKDINVELDDTIENSVVKNGEANPESQIRLPKDFPCECKSLHLKKESINCIRYLDDLDVEDYKLTHDVTVSSGWSSKNILLDFINNEFAPVKDSNNQQTVFTIKPSGNIFYKKERNQSHIISVLRNYGTTMQASDELEEMFGSKVFSFPKPIGLLKYLIQLSTDNDSWILDFFSGSGTIGHSCMALNTEDHGERKYIAVQLNENLDEKLKHENEKTKRITQNAIDFLDSVHKPHELSEITAERLRGAGDKIIKEHPDLEGKLDTGFRVFRIDSENENTDIRKPLKDVSQTDLFNSIGNIKKDRTPLDLLFGVVYASALPFDLKLETKKISDNTVYLYGYLDEDSGLVACFDNNISENTIKEIAKLKPLTAAFKDSSFQNSAAKINLSEQFRVIAPDTKVKVI